MANMCLVTKTAGDAAVITATTSAGVMLPANLQANEKSLVWRSTATTATLTITLAASASIDSVILGWTNFTAGATVTMKLFTLVADVSAVETLVVTPDAASYATGFGLWGADAETAGLTNNVQGFFLAAHATEKITIEIVDSGNADGYVEAGRVACGAKYAMVIGPSEGLEFSIVDKTRVTRAESTDMRVETGSKYRRMKCDFNSLSEADISRLLRTVKGGMVFISIFPDNTTTRLHVFNMFAARIEDYAERLGLYRATSITFEEI